MASVPNFRSLLNRCMPVAKKGKLGDVVYDLIAQNNALRTDLIAVRTAVTTGSTTVAAITATAVLTPEQR